MLAPHDRRVILEALRPPDGYRVNRAIATTYTLDLVALLLAPLAFSLFDAVADRQKSLDSLALIKAVREHASRLTVFCQAEGIACPGRYPILAQYLEESVVPVMAPNDEGVFHVKLWVLRFEKGGEPFRYRVLVPSRNLTFDRSWDTLLALDGVLTDRKLAYARNHPLADLVAKLPTLAATGPSPRLETECGVIAEELRRVDFELPDHFQDVSFYPLGIGGKPRDPLDGRIDRLLVISPFVTADRLKELAAKARGSVLVSRVEELARVSQATLAGYEGGVFVLDDATTPDEDEDGGCERLLAVPELPPAHGLHAKVYVADAGRDGHVWTGSANATSAGFERNVELLVKLSGKKSDVGIDRILNGAGEGSFSTLLRRYSPNDAVTAEPERRDAELDRVARALAIARWQASVHAVPGPDEKYTTVLSTESPPSVPGAQVVIWPITLAEGRALTWTGKALSFEECSLEALTPFFAFRMTMDADPDRTTTFVVRAQLEGAPDHRGQRLLQSLFSEPNRLMRFLELLLASDSARSLGSELEILEETGGDSGRSGYRELPLFEMLIRALAKNPHQLEQVKTLLDDLGASVTEHVLLGVEFQDIWRPIWQAHLEGRSQP